jgi:hypothetical protein
MIPAGGGGVEKFSENFQREEEIWGKYVSHCHDLV